MLIDNFAPSYDVRSRYEVDIHAPLERVYAATRNLDMGRSWIVRGLYLLRGLPTTMLTLDEMLKWGFVLLADVPCQEIVFGLIGRFWTTSAGVRIISADGFAGFDEPGYAKATANIAFTLLDLGVVRVSTETRVSCVDDDSRRNFRLYWLLIGPFSGLIRREWLILIKQGAERGEN